MTDAPALLPCPFCGGDAEIEQYGDNRKSTIVACTECACRMENGEAFRHGTIWNTRARPMTVSEAATHWAITSPSGMHIGLWPSHETAKRVFDNEVNGSKLWPLRALSQGGE